jgi:hypothetical protein
VRYKLGSYTPEDDILHSHRRENLKSYMIKAARISASFLRCVLSKQRIRAVNQHNGVLTLPTRIVTRTEMEENRRGSGKANMSLWRKWLKGQFKIKLYLHRSLSISFPAHIVANATLMENTRILPTFSLQKQTKCSLNQPYERDKNAQTFQTRLSRKLEYGRNI